MLHVRSKGKEGVAGSPDRGESGDLRGVQWVSWQVGSAGGVSESFVVVMAQQRQSVASECPSARISFNAVCRFGGGGSCGNEVMFKLHVARWFAAPTAGLGRSLEPQSGSAAPKHDSNAKRAGYWADGRSGV